MTRTLIPYAGSERVIIRRRPQIRVRDMVDTTDSRIGNRIRDARIAKRMTQRELAAKLGLSLGPIQHYERGRNAITVDRLSQIAKVLERPVTWFFT